MKYFSHTNSDIKTMLEVIKINSIDSLFESIPNSLRLKKEINIPLGMSEIEIKRFLKKNIINDCKKYFVGGGLYKHFVPEVVKQLINRGEWLTGYTPYQAEVSQGTLQSIFEFQTLVSNIYGCEIANASLYDCGTAIIEALLMTLRIKNKKTVIISGNIHPEYINICKTYAKICNFHIIKMPFNYSSGNIDINKLEYLLKNNNVASVLYQYPNFFGGLENQKEIIEIVHKYDSLIITANPDPLVFGMSKPPGLLGADVIVGEGIGFCPFTGLGSPGLGLFATKKNILDFYLDV